MILFFDAGLNNAKINTNFGYDEYEVNIEFYEDREITEVIELLGIIFVLSTNCQSVKVQKPENETDFEVIQSKMINYIKTYDY